MKTKAVSATEDQKIVELYEERNEQAIAETSARYGNICRSVAKNILGNTEDAEECLNDALLKAWNAIPPARPAHFGAYFMTLARNTALKRYKARHAEKRGSGQMELALAELTDCVAADDSVEKTVDRQELLAAIVRALGNLPEEHRNLFIRRYWHVSPIAEIAEDFGMTESSVKVTLMRIRKRLQKSLRKEGFL